MRVLITGITGFAGSYLAEYALGKGAEVYGSIRWRSRTENIEHIKDRINLVECDMRDLSSVIALVKRAEPSYVFHLAAQSFVYSSWHAPGETLTTNIIGQVNLLEALRAAGIDARVHIAGSSEEYGLVLPEEVPIRETNPLRPLSPYAVSKVAQDLLAYQYFKSYGQPIIRARAFNHTGPRRGDVFVTSNFAKQLAQIEAGLSEPVIRVGNLEAVRDFTDVRDMVEAYWLLLEKAEPGEAYNICSGRGWAIKDLLQMLRSLCSVEVEVRQDPNRLRPSDVPVLIGDCSKFQARTGWRPSIPFEKTVEDLLNYWREKIPARSKAAAVA